MRWSLNLLKKILFYFEEIFSETQGIAFDLIELFYYFISFKIHK